jgi:hypothetical protein
MKLEKGKAALETRFGSDIESFQAGHFPAIRRRAQGQTFFAFFRW